MPDNFTFTGLPFEQAIEFLKRKVNISTLHWDDLWRGMHSREFMVAGAMQEDLVQDFHDAINKAITDGTTLREFQKNFDDLVQKYGWSYHGERNWRSALIYDTNLRTAYSAGRWKQQTDPDVQRQRPWLIYKHMDGVLHPRPEHLAWNNMSLPADDPWWEAHYPPNGWGCHCYVVSGSDNDLDRMGKQGPDTAPPTQYYSWKDRTGKVHQVPVGIDPGWDYNPGKAAYDEIPDFSH
jgi:uncharacterized protein with gpF-like domain